MWERLKGVEGTAPNVKVPREAGVLVDLSTLCLFNYGNITTRSSSCLGVYSHPCDGDTRSDLHSN